MSVTVPVRGWKLAVAGMLSLMVSGANCQQLSPLTVTKIGSTVRSILVTTAVPSAEVGVAVGGRIVWVDAFGSARLAPPVAATVGMAYPIGSISKQFTAACVLLLEQEGKLRLDDPVSRWFPQLTEAKEVTVRELLSHTSGYEDYAPQDYTIPAWMTPTEPAAVVREWAGKPLDFEPGTQWQYSNTNFVLAALIVEKASGEPYFQFLREKVLNPLGLKNALNLDTERGQLQVQGYERHALGPLRPAVLEAPGWYYGDASLAMPVGDLLKWDVSVMNETLLKPNSYREMETATKLKNGTDTRYGLGLTVRVQNGHRVLEHSGEVGGYTAENIVLPDDKIAVAVLTNQEASDAAGEIAKAVLRLVLAPEQGSERADDKGVVVVRQVLSGLLEGKLDRGLLTADASFYFSAGTIEDFRNSLIPLGLVTGVKLEGESLRGGMTERTYTATFAGGAAVGISTYWTGDGKLEQFLVTGRK